MNTKGTHLFLHSVTWRRGKQPQQIPNNMYVILLFSHQLGHLISTHLDQKSTSAVGNPEGFLLPSIQQAVTADTTGKQSPERNLLDVTY